jgi:hypothetical protein
LTNYKGDTYNECDMTNENVPLLYKFREFVAESPGDTYMTHSTGSAGREDDYEDPSGWR